MRHTLRGLLPNNDYAVQLRAKDGDKLSEWSRRFRFDTNVVLVRPRTPENLTVEQRGEAFHAEWDAVTDRLNGKPATINYYEVEVTGYAYKSASTQVKIASVPQKSESRVNFNLSLEKNRNFFGTARPEIGIRVRAVDNNDRKSDWTAMVEAGNAAPDAVSNFVATPITEGIDLTWDASTDVDFAEYVIWVGLSEPVSTAGTPVFQGNATQFTYYTGTQAEHFFVIVAMDKFGLASDPATASAEPISPFVLDDTPPAIPSGLGVTASSGAPPVIATATWTFNEATAGNENVAGFIVQWRKVGDTNWFSEYADRDVRAVTVELPAPYANYEFKIASFDGVGNISNYSSTTTLSNSVPGAPPTLTGVVVTPGIGSLDFKWNASAHNDVVYGGYYEVQIATNSGFSTGLLTYQTGNTYLNVSGLSFDTLYYYRVRAVDSTASAGAWTSSSATTDGLFVPDPTDGNVPASSPAATVTPGIGVLHVSWSPITNNDLVTYEVHVSVTNGFTPNSGTKAAETVGTIVTLKNTAGGTALAYGTTYYVKILAKDGDGPAASAGTQGSGTPTKAGSGDITTIIADQIAAGSYSGGSFVVASGGDIRSSNYVGGTSGYRLTDTVLDIRNGAVAANVLVGGTISSADIRLGAGGIFQVDSTGKIQSNNYAAASTGWKLDSTGLELNQGTLRAVSIISPNITAGGTTINSSGITGSGFSLTGSSLSITAGTIDGPAVHTNTLRSKTLNASTSSGVNFAINEGGFTEIAGLKVYGNTTVGNSSSHWIQSGNWVSNTDGWKIFGSGNAEFNQGTITGALFRTKASGNRVEISQSVDTTLGQVRFYNSGNTLIGTLSGQTGASTNIRLVNPSGGEVSISNPGGIYLGTNQQIVLEASDDINITALGAEIVLGSTLNFNGWNLKGVGVVLGGLAMSTGNLNMGSNDITNVGDFGGTIKMSGLGGTNGERYVYVNNAGTLSRGAATSSAKFKRNIENIDHLADKVVQLEPVEFDWVESKGGGRSVGFIAEQADKLGLHQWVGYEDDEPAGIDYPFMVVAQQTVIRKHEKTIKSLEKRISKLEDRL